MSGTGQLSGRYTRSHVAPGAYPKLAFVGYKLRVHAQLIFSFRLVPLTMSLPLYVAAVVPITFIVINAWWDRHWKLRNLPTPVCFSFVFMALALSFRTFSNPRSINPRPQAGVSLVWGHDKFEFEDDQGYQWRRWFKECGRAFKIKAAWVHPEIVRKGPYPQL